MIGHCHVIALQLLNIISEHQCYINGYNPQFDKTGTPLSLPGMGFQRNKFPLSWGAL